MRALLGALAGLLFSTPACGLEVNKYLIMSAPRLAKVTWTRIGGDHAIHPLIETTVKSPQGLAVHQKLNKLYVADPDSRKVFCYKLIFNNGVLMTADAPQIAAQNIEARWVAVDGVGNLFVTDERNNLILKVPADRLAKGDPTPLNIYSGLDIAAVSAPGGIAADNFYLFWSNKAVGMQVGSVVQGYENPPDNQAAASVRPIAKNSMKVYGVCLTNNNIYYSNSDSSLFAVKKHGGTIATVTDKLLQPRGCTWDGDGTVYVADKGANAVYSFPGNMHNLRWSRLTKTVDMEDAFGVAVIAGARRTLCGAAWLVVSLGLAAALPSW